MNMTHPHLEREADRRDLQHGPEWGDTAYICSNCADRPWNVGDGRAGVRYCGCSIWQNAEWSGWRNHMIHPFASEELGEWTLKAVETEGGYHTAIIGDPLAEGDEVRVREIPE